VAVMKVNSADIIRRAVSALLVMEFFRGRRSPPASAQLSGILMPYFAIL
jgi:ribulose kinase